MSREGGTTRLVPPGAALAVAIERTAQLLAASSTTPRLDAEVLVRHVSGATRADCIARPHQPLGDAAARELATLIERRASGTPIAYLTGVREFWSLELAVSPATLIPRPETELLVERALAHTDPRAAARIVDLGTGSGAIALAIARERPQARIVATDRSAAALAVARANAERHGVTNVEFRAGDWFDALAGGVCDLIVSNPPYLRADDPHLREGDVRHEPAAALVAGATGLEALTRLIADAPPYLRADGWLLLEHGHDQGAAVRALYTRYGYRDVRSHRDLAGHHRVTEARRP